MKRNCQVCESNYVEELFTNFLAPLDQLNMSYTLARCKKCGFHFASDLPDETQYFKYYTDLSKYDSQPFVSPLDQERINAAVDLFLRLNISKEARIVDLGCGFGALLASLKKAGYRHLLGLDPAPQSEHQARQQFQLDGVRQGNLRNANEVLDLNQTDVICLMAVLEHLPNLKHDIAILLNQLKSDTKVLIEVPALDLFDGLQGEPLGEFSIEHIQYFSAQSLRNLLTQSGARIVYEKLLPLTGLNSGALFVFAEITHKPISTVQNESPDKMNAYLSGSLRRWNLGLKRIPERPFVLYGAGSHSARLLPQLSPLQLNNLVSVVDGNANLQGKYFDKWLIEPPEALQKYLNLPILISSYRSENIIAADLKRKFPGIALQLMYDRV
jgi:2-polyprenyl-3-methyl-5-hydroxy-6-metoxy-1,4-benzoquinol methylase